ncbi:unnamed protein product [Urochloa decumbens]|uniref:Uncharacterized protein n=1 Tax=Urochloa decumbens TaxID=240449 RepID=A0ABC9CA68_9POAL
MSSTATSALRRAPSDTCDAADADAVHGRLEKRLVDLERDWDAYMSGRRSSPPPRSRHRHRRSRSATGTPPSAVTVAAAPDDGLLLLPLYRCSSPRALVSSLQQAGSAAADSDGADEIVDEEGLSSVCSVEEAGKNSAAAPASSSCSCCPCRCAFCRGGYSARSSRSGRATAPSSSSGSAAGDRARKSDGGREEVAGACRASWISAVALVVMGFVFVAMAALEIGVDDGCAEYLVPT